MPVVFLYDRDMQPGAKIPDGEKESRLDFMNDQYIEECLWRLEEEVPAD